MEDIRGKTIEGDVDEDSLCWDMRAGACNGAGRKHRSHSCRMTQTLPVDTYI